MKSPIAFAALLIAVLWSGVVGASSIEYDGRLRTFEMYVPPTAPRPLPVVLVLHGGKGTSAQIRQYTHFDHLAEREGFIAVYPQGLGGEWNDGRPEIANVSDQAADTDDVAFLLAVVDTLVDRGLADRHRVYVAGISNGGMMALHLACEHPERVAGTAVVAANQPVDVECQPDRPVPIIFFHGTNDRFMPYAGGDILQWANIDRGKVRSARETVEQWLEINGCSDDSDDDHPIERKVGKRATVDRITFESCSGAPVEQYVTHGGGHAWPGAEQSAAGDVILGSASVGIDASEEIWRFFKSQPPR
jgi:polyhydroxybutyrate depolymerase